MNWPVTTLLALTGKLRPLLPRSLAATSQNISPEPINALSEDAQLIDFSWNRVVLVVVILPCP
jgi:hypothetical protein